MKYNWLDDSSSFKLPVSIFDKIDLKFSKTEDRSDLELHGIESKIESFNKRRTFPKLLIYTLIYYYAHIDQVVNKRKSCFIKLYHFNFLCRKYRIRNGEKFLIDILENDENIELLNKTHRKISYKIEDITADYIRIPRRLVDNNTAMIEWVTKLSFDHTRTLGLFVLYKLIEKFFNVTKGWDLSKTINIIYLDFLTKLFATRLSSKVKILLFAHFRDVILEIDNYNFKINFDIDLKENTWPIIPPKSYRDSLAFKASKDISILLQCNYVDFIYDVITRLQSYIFHLNNTKTGRFFLRLNDKIINLISRIKDYSLYIIDKEGRCIKKLEQKGIIDTNNLKSIERNRYFSKKQFIRILRQLNYQSSEIQEILNYTISINKKDVSKIFEDLFRRNPQITINNKRIPQTPEIINPSYSDLSAYYDYRATSVLSRFDLYGHSKFSEFIYETLIILNNKCKIKTCSEGGIKIRFQNPINIKLITSFLENQGVELILLSNILDIPPYEIFYLIERSFRRDKNEIDGSKLIRDYKSDFFLRKLDMDINKLYNEGLVHSSALFYRIEALNKDILESRLKMDIPDSLIGTNLTRAQIENYGILTRNIDTILNFSHSKSLLIKSKSTKFREQAFNDFFWSKSYSLYDTYIIGEKINTDILLPIREYFIRVDERVLLDFYLIVNIETQNKSIIPDNCLLKLEFINDNNIIANYDDRYFKNDKNSLSFRYMQNLPKSSRKNINVYREYIGWIYLNKEIINSGDTFAIQVSINNNNTQIKGQTEIQGFKIVLKFYLSYFELKYINGNRNDFNDFWKNYNSKLKNNDNYFNDSF